MANENEPRNDETPEQPEGTEEQRASSNHIMGRDKEQPAAGSAARVQGTVALEELEKLPATCS